MSEKDPVFFAAPCQQRRVIDTRESNILHSNKVNVWNASPETTNDVAVEILITQESKQGYSPTDAARALSEAKRSALLG